MTDHDNPLVKLATQDLAITNERRTGLVGRGLDAVLTNNQVAVADRNDAIYRQARAAYNRLTDDGLGMWSGYKEREAPLSEVFNTFLQLAAEGYGKAYFPLSALYSGWQSIEADSEMTDHYHELAFDWLRGNQHLDDPEIWHDLGAIYVDDKSIELSIHWFKKAADAGDASSMWELTGVYEHLESWEKALYWQIKAAKAGHEKAQQGLEGQHEHGDLETKIDDEQVFNWYIWSAEQGHVWAQLFLAKAAAQGHVLEPAAKKSMTRSEAIEMLKKLPKDVQKKVLQLALLKRKGKELEAKALALKARRKPG